MTNPTPVAEIKRNPSGQIFIDWSIEDPMIRNIGMKLFTEAQLDQARADALREAADNVNLWLPNMPTVVRDRVSEELRRTADEMEKGK